MRDAGKLRYLAGGGDGCNYHDETFSHARRWWHQAMAYGFLLCFAATSVATIYDYGFGWQAPYPFFSLPVLLGTVGGLGLLIGCAGLMWLKIQSDSEPRDSSQIGMEVGFLLLLFLTSLTGLILLALRETSAMGMLLAIHLGIVLALFLLLPYSKFVHGIYRYGALVRYALERKS
jgi:citrate/tricarballylate utilization protein